MEAIASPKRPVRRHRRAKLELLIGEAGSVSALAEQVEIPGSLLSAIRNGSREIGDVLATKIEEKTGKVFGWMDYSSGI